MNFFDMPPVSPNGVRPIWFSVEDRLPEMLPDMSLSADVLVCCISNGGIGECALPNTYSKSERYLAIDRLIKWNDRKEPSFRSDRFYGKVTHWMQLPEFPNEKDS